MVNRMGILSSGRRVGLGVRLLVEGPWTTSPLHTAWARWRRLGEAAGQATPVSRLAGGERRRSLLLSSAVLLALECRCLARRSSGRSVQNGRRRR